MMRWLKITGPEGSVHYVPSWRGRPITVRTQTIVTDASGHRVPIDTGAVIVEPVRSRDVPPYAFLGDILDAARRGEILGR